MANKIKIPGELESAAKDGIVASAEAIKDYNLNKTLQTLNSKYTDAINEFNSAADRIDGYVGSILAAIQDIQNMVEGETDATFYGEMIDALQKLHAYSSALQAIASLLGATYDSTSSVYLPGLKFVIVTELEMESLLDNNETDPNTLYFLIEEEEQ